MSNLAEVHRLYPAPPIAGRSPDVAPQLAPEVAQLIARMAAALRSSQVAVEDWICVTAPESCEPARVRQARERILEHGALFYLATVGDAVRHALRGAPVAFDPEHRDAQCWRAFCALPHAVRVQLVAENVTPTTMDTALDRRAGLAGVA